MSIYLETQRLILKAVEAKDEALLLDLDSDPEVMTYLNGGRASTVEEVRGAMDRILNLLQTHNGRFGVFTAVEKEAQQFIGWFLFRPDKEDPQNIKRIEVGYRLKKKFWGLGYATEASKALCGKGFQEFNLDEVFAVAMKKNTGSQNVMKKIGLRFVRDFDYLEFPTADKSAVLYKITREEWLKRRS